MKMILSENIGHINVGDIIENSEYGICMITYDVDGTDGRPYKLVNMQTGRIKNSYRDDSLIQDGFRLLIRNSDLVISDFEGEEE